MSTQEERERALKVVLNDLECNIDGVPSSYDDTIRAQMRGHIETLRDRVREEHERMERKVRREAFEACIRIAETTPLVQLSPLADRQQAAITSNLRARLAELEKEKP